MLIKPKSLLLAFLGTAVWFLIVGTAASLLVPYQTEVCSLGEQAQHNQCFTYNYAYLIWRGFFDVLNYISPTLTIAATGAVAWFTATIWHIARRQLRHHQEVERAYVTGGGFRHQGTNDFVFTVQNYGKTPGFFEGYAVFFCDVTQLPPNAPPNLLLSRTMTTFVDAIAPNAPFKTIKVFTNVLGYRDPIAYGRFWYRDIWENELYFFSFILPVNSPDDHSSVANVDREYTKWT